MKMNSKAIGQEDIVSVRGKYLYKADGTRFFMKGIAFPAPVEEKDYDAATWIKVLHQFKSLDLEYNTVRLYRMDPSIDYSEFFNEAASLGIYVIVPLTAAKGKGDLKRDKEAPKCYNRNLFGYGVSCLHNYLQYPNTLGGMLGNEVMNSVETWTAAPCIKAYGRDLKVYMQEHQNQFNRTLPLIYAAQNTGLGASLDDVDTMRVTSDYLTCEVADNSVFPMISSSLVPATMNGGGKGSAIDIYGINVESWCSSKGSFEYNEDGTIGSYYKLHEGLRNSTIPLLFTEMGCSHLHFDKDNGLATENGDRDWKQVSVVLNEMSDIFSGFCAYAYYGNSQFNMFKGGPWRGQPLEPLQDFFNYRDELKKVANFSFADSVSTGSGMQEIDFSPKVSPSCNKVEAELRSCCKIEMHDFKEMKSYSSSSSWLNHSTIFGIVLVGIVLFFVNRRKKANQSSSPPNGGNVQVTYQSINL